MTDNEKLIEILRVPIFPHDLVDPVEAAADYLLDNDVVPVVRCKTCKNRGDANNCPMCFEAESEFDDGDGYMSVDYITRDHTVDDGYCHKGERSPTIGR